MLRDPVTVLPIRLALTLGPVATTSATRSKYRQREAVRNAALAFVASKGATPNIRQRLVSRLTSLSMLFCRKSIHLSLFLWVCRPRRFGFYADCSLYSASRRSISSRGTERIFFIAVTKRF